MPTRIVPDYALENPGAAAGGGSGGGDGGLPSYTFTSCVNGTPMSFDIPIYRGPY